jgi:hypothetical protein
MPLIPTVLETAIKTKLQIEFIKPAVKQSLRTKLDGGGLAGGISSAKNIDKALSNIKTLSMAINFGASGGPAAAVGNKLVKKFTANEWSNAISDSVCEWMSDEIAPIIARIIASEVTNYIKTATIIVPPGQVVATAGSPAAQVGSTTAPSPPAIIT